MRPEIWENDGNLLCLKRIQLRLVSHRQIVQSTESAVTLNSRPEVGQHLVQVCVGRYLKGLGHEERRELAGALMLYYLTKVWRYTAVPHKIVIGF